MAGSDAGLNLVWVEDLVESRLASGSAIYARCWDAVAGVFKESIPGDASGPTGVASDLRAPQGVSLASNAAGQPILAWQGSSGDAAGQILLRANTTDVSGTVYFADGSYDNSVQVILDRNTLSTGDAIVITGSSSRSIVIAAGGDDANFGLIGTAGATASAPT